MTGWVDKIVGDNDDVGKIRCVVSDERWAQEALC